MTDTFGIELVGQRTREYAKTDNKFDDEYHKCARHSGCLQSTRFRLDMQHHGCYSEIAKDVEMDKADARLCCKDSLIRPALGQAT